MNGKRSRSGSGELFYYFFKAFRLEVDLRLCEARNVPRKLLAFNHQARIAETWRDVLNGKVCPNARTILAVCNQVFQFDPAKILNETATFHDEGSQCCLMPDGYF